MATTLLTHEERARQFGGIGWGAFFVWLAIVFMSGIPEAVAWFGIGVITLSVQGLRRAYDLPAEGFWLGAGVMFVLAGLWGILSIGIPLVPTLLGIFGATLILVAVLRAGRAFG